MTRGYWKRPEETAAAFADGFFLTGDIGCMDEDGYFFIVDRKKDMIICGGFNVYPQMIEQAIYEHPSVDGSASWSACRTPTAASRPRPSSRCGRARRASRSTICSEFLADKLGPHEMPGDLEIRDSLPRTPVGKLSKLELREEERRLHDSKVRRIS